MSTSPSAQAAFRSRNSHRPAAAAPENTLISQIKSAKAIDDLIGQYVRLKPASGGKELVGKCNFHDDSTPSLYVNPGEGTYNCRGCGASGNVVHFYAHVNGLDYDEAKMALAKELGLLQERKVSGPQFVLTKTLERYRSALSGCRMAQEYLTNRGISPESVEKFGLGYCWGNEFVKASEAFKEDAKKAGVYSAKSGRSYLGGRLTFPIRNRSGAVIAFAGRKLERATVAEPDAWAGDEGEAKKAPPKYLNTPETELFHKSEHLYGLYEAKHGVRDQGFAVVVEGYIDVVMLHQYGIDNSVAVMGADANEKAFAGLWAMTDRMVFCLDGDAAGQMGTRRSIQKAAMSMKDGQSIAVAMMPNGMDPDEFVREHGADPFRDRLGNALPLSKYLAQETRARFDLANAEDRAAFVLAMRDAASWFESAPLVAQEIVSEAEAECMAYVIGAALGPQGAGLAADPAELRAALATALAALDSQAVGSNVRKAAAIQAEPGPADTPSVSAPAAPAAGPTAPAAPRMRRIGSLARVTPLNVSGTSEPQAQNSAPAPYRKALLP